MDRVEKPQSLFKNLSSTQEGNEEYDNIVLNGMVSYAGENGVGAMDKNAMGVNGKRSCV